MPICPAHSSDNRIPCLAAPKRKLSHMTKKKIIPTRTLNPLHFEDLDPHRFEDLVRRLLYNFRDWTDIQPTGRAGSDEGFDVRAFERQETATNTDEEGEEGSHGGASRIWQIQAKREKTITPVKMRSFLRDSINGDDPPHGFILAAATNISKTTLDVFREEAKEKGVHEFYFWGKDYLEDQLSLPQNDDILFTFFGISLSPRRKSRTAEIKFGINNKNKLLKLLLGGEPHNNGMVGAGRSVLLRDIKDTAYPDSDEYPDFEKHQRWSEFEVFQVTARGMILKARERYAYYDSVKKEWDFTLEVDLRPRRHDPHLTGQGARDDKDLRVEGSWRHLKRSVQARLKVYGFVPYDEILLIDEKGDPSYPSPHLYLDFGDRGPIRGFAEVLTQGYREIGGDEIQNLKQAKVFPAKFPALPTKRTIHRWSDLGLPDKIPVGLRTLYSFDGKLSSLKEWDVVSRPNPKGGYEEHQEITHVYESTVAVEIEGAGHLRTFMADFAGRDIRDDEAVVIFETCRVILPTGAGAPVSYLSESY